MVRRPLDCSRRVVLFALTGLVVMMAGSRLTDSFWGMTAWAVLPVSALWTVTTAVAEATVVADAAIAGANQIFHEWWAFAEGKAHGFAVFALAVAVIAGREARSRERNMPGWSAWTGTAASITSFAG